MNTMNGATGVALRAVSIRVAIMAAVLAAILAGCTNLPGARSDAGDGTYSGDWSSLESHQTPEWFLDAKFGIFIHWGPYSVPAWTKRQGYAEWYARRMYELPAYRQYHTQNYGDLVEFGYSGFVDAFTAEHWDPEGWADVFAQSGAKLVVPVAEHHDGFALWDSALTSWDAVDRGPRRDLIGELEVAVRARGLKYAPSYHRERHFSYFRQPSRNANGKKRKPWAVDPQARPFGPIQDEIRHTPEAAGLYGPFALDAGFIADYVARWKEIETKYSPDMMWLDDIPVFYQSPNAREVAQFKAALVDMIADYINGAEAAGRQVAVNNKGKNANFPEGFGLREADYLVSDTIRERPWIASRGIGRSYGYNKTEENPDGTSRVYASSDTLIETLVDVVSKNGFFLLNVGPRADGTISDAQTQRLLDMGRWLDVYGSAIYATRPWKLSADDRVRYTRNGADLFVFAFDPPGDVFVIPAADGVVTDGLSVRALGEDARTVPWRVTDGGIELDLSGVDLPSDGPLGAVTVFKLVNGAG